MFQRDGAGSKCSFFSKAIQTAAALFLCTGLLAAGTAQAQIRIVTGVLPPLTDDSGTDKGFLYDVVEEIKKLVKVSAPIEMMLWTDASKIAQNEANIVIFPLTRTPQRENSFRWITKMFDMKRSFTTLPGVAPINSPEEAKKIASIGVLERSSSQTFLKEYGLTNTVEFPSNKALVEGLAAGKVASIYGINPMTVSEWRGIGRKDQLVFGTPVEITGSFIGTSLKGDLVKMEEWQSAFEVIQQDGTFDRLLAKYGLN
ncbi:substrate-binding periplasmic protein [Skermanella pratensis]|uniref:substrate-binding periplasmic protein n=1 Tax=Skermanella pratensis TaxID=2233999 RepID=UPI00130132B3|nr:transporter substrate-binding domain-containing protein [Skermanella pratensis]